MARSERLKVIRSGYDICAGEVLMGRGLYTRQPVNTLYFSTWMPDPANNHIFACISLELIFSFCTLRHNVKYCVMNVALPSKTPFLLHFFIITNKNSPFEVCDPSRAMCRFISLHLCTSTYCRSSYLWTEGETHRRAMRGWVFLTNWDVHALSAIFVKDNSSSWHSA